MDTLVPLSARQYGGNGREGKITSTPGSLNDSESDLLITCLTHVPLNEMLLNTMNKFLQD